MENIREISLDGCEVTGHGKNGDVYSIDSHRIAKVFDKGSMSDEEIEQEYRLSCAAYELGIPTARCYEMAEWEGVKCILYEKIEGTNLRELVREAPDRIDEYIGMGAMLSRKLHDIYPSTDIFPSMYDIYHARVDASDDLFTSREREQMHALIDSIPQKNTYIHGDYHRGNLIMREGKLVLIDMADSAYGHPVFDVLSTYMVGPFLFRTVPAGFIEKLTGWTEDIIRNVWDVFCRRYFMTEDPGQLDKINDRIGFLCMLRYMTFLHILPGMTDEVIRQAVHMARETFFPFIETRIHEIKTEGLAGF